MVLVALYRSGPLRQRLAKGYSVYVPDAGPGRGAAELVAALCANPPLLPGAAPGAQGCGVHGDPRTPGALWVDTGRVSLHDPAARAYAAGALAAAVAHVAGIVRQQGGMLIPSGWQHHPEAAAGLCADLHSVEVLGPVQRELTANLVREHTAALAALTGRQLYGPAGVSAGGSARLSRRFDQVGTRYLDSCSPEHLERVRVRLRQEERLSGLDAMDVNPLGESGAGAAGDVTVRLLDAQVTVASAMAHALLVQALSMAARDMERTGRRARLIPQQVIEQNRSRAVAHGLAAEFRVDQGPPKNNKPRNDKPRNDKPRNDKPGDEKPGNDKPGNGDKNAKAGRGDGGPPATVPAVRAALGMLEELMPFLRQLDATAEELGPLLTGLELADSTAAASDFVRNENDLLAHWQAHDATALAPERLTQGLGMPDWLTTDHLGAVNSALAPGSSSAARLWLAERLSGESSAAASATSARSDKPRQKAAPQRELTAIDADGLLARLGEPDVRPREAVDALRAYCLGEGELDLTRPLRSRSREDARALRRLLRPRAAQRVRCAAPIFSWDDEAAPRAVRGAGERGVALLEWDVAAQDVARVRAGLRSVGRPPGGIRHVLLTDTTYTAGEGERRGKVEVLLVAPRKEANAG
ncbi:MULTISPECIES: hypothetical protein [unclassified Streptomyces]|uniref:hypothetical protein n=1 Tax=unclassified Streptomyces TaxID=2593676 RepID=UPI00278C29E5|nr:MULTISPECIES: hypothetical protein [unclassified Streptomyces]